MSLFSVHNSSDSVRSQSQLKVDSQYNCLHIKYIDTCIQEISHITSETLVQNRFAVAKGDLVFKISLYGLRAAKFYSLK